MRYIREAFHIKTSYKYKGFFMNKVRFLIFRLDFICVRVLYSKHKPMQRFTRADEPVIANIFFIVFS